MPQSVYYVAYPRSSQAYKDERTPTWLNQIRYYNVCLKFFVAKCLLCCISQKLSVLQWCQDSNLAGTERYTTVCLNFVSKWLLCCTSQKRSGIRWSQDSSLGATEKIFKYAWKLNYVIFGVQYNRAFCLLTLFSYLRVHKCLVYLFC